MKKMIIFFCALFAFANLCFGARITSDTLEITANPSGTPSTSDKTIQFGVTASANKGCIGYVYATPRVRLSQDCSDYVALLAESGALGIVGTSANGSTDVLNLKDSGESEVFAVDTDGNTSIQGNFVQPLGKYFDIGTGSTANTLSVNGIVALKYGGPAIGETGFSKLYGQTDDQLYFTPENDETATIGMEKTQTITADRTLNSTDRTIIVDPSADVTIDLPAASSNVNRVYTIKAFDLAHSIIVDANSTELIDGEETFSFTRAYETITIICDGTSWHIKSREPGVSDEDLLINDLVKNVGISGSVGSNNLTVSLKQSNGSSDPTSSFPSYIAFRDSTLTNGAFNTIGVTSSLSVVAPSGATLGTNSGVAKKVWVLAINNAGTVELALTTTLPSDETQFISTTAIDTSSDSAGGIYSTSARSNVPFRKIGYVVASQATAGTWASSPTIVFAGPIVERELIQVVATDTSGSEAVTNGATLSWNTTTLSTHGSSVWSGSVFTAPRDGVLEFHTTAKTGAVTPTAGQSYMIKAIKNGSTITHRGNLDYAQSTTNRAFSSIVTGAIPLSATETVEFQFEEDIPAVNLSASAGYNTLYLNFK